MLSLVFLIIDLLRNVGYHLTVVLVSVLLMISDAEHLFMYLAICMSPLENVYSNPLFIFKIGYLVCFAIELYEYLVYFGY